MKPVVRTLVAVAALSPVCLVASDRPHLESTFISTPIVVDGHQDDWSGALAPFGTEPVSIQVANDGDALYVRLSASDAGTRREILRQGLIVWFDEGGGAKKRLGVHYPVHEGGSGGWERGRGGHARSDPEAAQDAPSERIDILGASKDDARSLTRDHASGVEVALSTVEGSLVYELKIPLAKSADHPYAIGAAPGATIGIGLETPKMERPSGQESNGYGGGHGGGMGGRGGGGMGGGMHGRGMPREGGGTHDYQQPKPLKTWGTVTLSRPPGK